MLVSWVTAFLFAITYVFHNNSLATEAILIPCLFFAVFAFYKRYWVVSGLLVGFVWASFQGHLILASQLQSNLHEYNIEVIGTISTFVKRSTIKQRFEFLVSDTPMQEHQALIGKTIRLSWYYSDEVLALGDQWKFTVKLKRPRGLMSAGSFDYEKSLLQKSISAVGYIRSKQAPQKLSSVRHYTIDHLRLRIVELIEQQDISDESKALLKALSLGNSTDIKAQQWEWFRKTGTTHLLVISGLHIGLMAGVSAAIAGFLWSFWAVITRPWLSRLVVVSGAALAMAFIYSMLAGFTVPTLRALIMLAVYIYYQFARRHTGSATAYFIALLMVLVLIPLSPLSPGFWLSFGSVLAIGLMDRRFMVNAGWLVHWSYFHVVLAVILLPFTSLFFSSASLVAPLANFICIPVLSLLIVPLGLIGLALVAVVPFVGKLLIAICAFLLEWMVNYLEYLASFEMGQLWLGSHPWWVYMLVVIGLIVLILPRGTGLNLLAIPLSLVLLMPKQSEIKDTEFRVHVLDVGQGLSVWVETKNHNLLFDTGGRLTREVSMVKAIVHPYLRSKNHTFIDKVVISHPDSDHSAGLDDIKNMFKVGAVTTSKVFADQFNANEICNDQLAWQWDGVEFKFENHWRSVFDKKNDNSCVLRISNIAASVLLTGDIEKTAELDLVAQGINPVNLIIAPHHGSKTSSSQQLLDVLSPDIVVYTMAYNNRYHFPHPTVVKRYDDLGVKNYRSDRDGTLVFNFTLSGLDKKVYRHRELYNEFWRSSD